MATIAYFDCFSGAAGDMILGALCDAGVSIDSLRQALKAVPIQGYTITAEKVRNQGLAATAVRVVLDDTAAQPHRHLGHIIDILGSSDLSPVVIDRAKRVFQRLAAAEAAAHGTDVQDVHFHEVGAVDAIVDVVGACLGLELLGVDQVRCSAMAVGSGTVRCAHGIMPVPAPATAVLIEGVPLADCDEPGELLTPTGAAVLTTLAGGYGPLGGMRIDRIGYGAGTRRHRERPDLLRVIIGESVQTEAQDADEVVVLEANLDDTSAEVIAYACDRLLAAGALETCCIPIQMKKGRGGTLIQVLARPEDADRIEQAVFEQTTTFGVRRHACRRRKLRRDWITVQTPFGPVRLKRGRRGSTPLTVSPEYEDCARAAEQHDVPLRRIQEEAMKAYADLQP